MRRKTSNKRTGWGLLVFAGLVVFCGIAFSPSLDAQEAKKSFKIGLGVLKDNPDYHNARTAFVNVLEKQKDMTIEFRLLDAYGDLDVYKRGLGRFVNEDKVALVFTTGTRSTQPAIEIVKDIPVVFTAVAAPVKSGIVKSMEHPGGNVTGTHCAVPVYAQVKAITRVLPNAKTIGIVYTKGEPNAEIQTEDFRDAAKKLGLEVLTSTVSKDCKTEEEISEAAGKLVGKVDVLVAHQDTSLSQYGKGMIVVAEKNNIPTYVSLGQLLAQGAVLSLSIDFKGLGTMSGEQAVKILKENINAADIPVETDKNYSLILNLTAAKKIGLSIPVQVLRSASKIIK
jgi:putative ABC transport system substrate-binding protein